MPERFFSLSTDDRKEALEVAASQSGRPAYLLEKDVWVVWTLGALFDSPFAKDLIFRGGTSLSKVYHVIDRFSEDIDVTYDIRAIAHDLVKDAGADALPATKSQARKWRDTIDDRLATWIEVEVSPYIEQRLSDEMIDAHTRVERDSLYIDYRTNVSGYGYIPTWIKIEFGGRSTGEPTEELAIACDAAEFLPGVLFPTAVPRVMRAERTAWEKMTAIHVFCLQGDIREQRARHWSDIIRLDAVGLIDAAIRDRSTARRVADHKSRFFVERDARGNPIDYHSAIHGALVLVPTGDILDLLHADYAKMVESRLFLRDAEPFEDVIARCADIQARANAIGVFESSAGPTRQPEGTGSRPRRAQTGC
jgi:hypothetical protein